MSRPQRIHRAVEQLVSEHGHSDFAGSERRRYEIGKVSLECWPEDDTTMVCVDCRPVFAGHGEKLAILEEGDWIDEILDRAGTDSGGHVPPCTPDGDAGAVWEPVGCGWWLYTKDDGTGYVVNGFYPQCSCWGHKTWRHCKHIDWLEKYYEWQRREQQGSGPNRESRRAA
ncbi:MAG TPA: hypothetical protein VFI02_00790 [Armatimonadota bacterium]|nr:hypothetical protein [Armatimonadota bacterium]